MRKKEFLSRFCIILAAIILLFVTSVFADEENNKTVEQAIVGQDSLSNAELAERKFQWPKIQWPWNKNQNKEVEILKEKKLERMKAMLSRLVEEGQITQEKSDEIFKQYEEYIASKEFHIKGKESLLDKLVEDNVLTQREADSIKEAVLKKIEEKKKQGKLDKEDRAEVVKESLLELVQDGVITQEKLNEITKYHKEKMAEIKERKEDKDFWNDMVTKGIITEKEAEIIKESCKNFHKSDKKHHKD